MRKIEERGPVSEVSFSEGPSNVGVSLLSPEEENNFKNVVFSSLLESRTMNKDLKSGVR
jgi:hypothetical protein